MAARDGAPVVLVARSEVALAAAADDIRNAGGEAFTVPLDFLADDAALGLEDFLSANGLFCDVLVNSAGYGLRGGATVLPLDEQLGLVDLNIRALTELTLRLLPGMVARRRGGVINLGSVASFTPGPYMALYYASKGFVRSFSEALHQELRHTGVTVTCVAPGPVSTEFLATSGANRVALFKILPKLEAGYVAEKAWRGFKNRPPPRHTRPLGQADDPVGGAGALRDHAAPDRPIAAQEQGSVPLRLRQKFHVVLRCPRKFARNHHAKSVEKHSRNRSGHETSPSPMTSSRYGL